MILQVELDTLTILFLGAAAVREYRKRREDGHAGTF
jgi:hypothetical protein